MCEACGHGYDTREDETDFEPEVSDPIAPVFLDGFPILDPSYTGGSYFGPECPHCKSRRTKRVWDIRSKMARQCQVCGMTNISGKLIPEETP